jgi:hypothetical protein
MASKRCPSCNSFLNNAGNCLSCDPVGRERSDRKLGSSTTSDVKVPSTKNYKDSVTDQMGTKRK